MKNKLRKTSITIIAAVLLIGVCAGAASALDDYTGDVTLYVNNSGTFEVQSIPVSDVKTIYGASSAKAVKNVNDLKSIGAGTEGTLYILTDDIYFKSPETRPILGVSDANRFVGTLIGNGKTIYNLTISATANYAGLVGVLSKSATLNYIQLSNANIVSTKSYVGGLVGYATGNPIAVNGNITGCKVMHSDISSSGEDYVGGDFRLLY